MPLEEIRGNTLVTAYVLFMDIVSYSRLPIDQQERFLNELQEDVRSTTDFKLALASNELLPLPTGDGMALVFFADPEAPARCAIELSRALRKHPEIKVRMGIHAGPVYRVTDINANLNVAGGGINLAQRVMACGDGEHVLVSKQAADVLGQLSHWAGTLHDLGVVRVKHGLPLHLFNLYTVDFGNPATPRKLRLRRLYISLVAAAVLMAALATTVYLIVVPPPPPRFNDDAVFEWGKGIGNASISSDGSTIAFDSDWTGQREIYVVHTKGGKPVSRTRGFGEKFDPRINSDGAAILYIKQAESVEIWIVPADAGDPQRRISNASSADWSPDGNKIVYARERTGETASLRIYDLSTNTESTPIYTSDFQQIDSVRWSPKNNWIYFSDDAAWSHDGEYLFYSKPQNRRHAIWKLKVPSGRPEQVLAGKADYFCPVPLAESNALIYAHGRVQEKLISESTSTHEKEELASGTWLGNASISPDGGAVMYVEEGNNGPDESVENVQKVPFHGGEKVLIAGEGQYPVWSRDGKRVAYSKVVKDNGQKDYWHIFIKESDQGTTAERETRGDFDAYPDDWSPGGDSLLITQDAKEKSAILRLDVSTKKTFPIAEDLYWANYSEDGNWLLALGPPDKSDRRGLWILNSANYKPTRIRPEAVNAAKWALHDRAIIYSIGRKSRGNVNLLRLPMEHWKPSGKPSLFFSYMAASGGEDAWDVTEDLSNVVYIQANQVVDFYKRTPIR